jgi:5'-phosphate synthase pdxT subunit
MILLSDHAVMQQTGGQALVGGLDVQICRNFFGSQIHSCELRLEHGSDDYKELYPCSAVFIRAPAILVAGPEVEVIATVRSKPHISARAEVYRLLDSSITTPEAQDIEMSVIVAVKQKNILATAFHPELTTDIRWHLYFVKMVLASVVDSISESLQKS